MKISLLATGGTIASVESERGRVPGLSGEKLLESCPLLMGFEHDVEVENLFSKDSSNRGPADWLEMAKSIRRRAQSSDAVILLHGTDTLAWTSSVLSYLLHDIAVPVVLTGSMMLSDEPGSDAPDNIYAAFQFALQLAMYKRKGVAIAFADTLIHGPKAIKLDSCHKKAFSSVDYPLLGEMRDMGTHKVAWLTPKVPSLTDKRPWDDDAPAFETNIALAPIFPGMSAAALDAIVTGGANATGANAPPRAVVLEGFGLGGVPCERDSLLGPIEKGIRSGIPFVLRTQSPFGGTDPSIYEVGRKALDLGVLSAQDMTREALVTKLMLLLPLFKSKDLAEHLRANYCDEITVEITV
jgi:L-asparaginase